MKKNAKVSLRTLKKYELPKCCSTPKYEKIWHSRDEAGFLCKKCGSRSARPMTKREKKIFSDHMKSSMREAGRVHDLFFEFRQRIDAEKDVDKKREKALKWAESRKNKGVQIVRVDDNVYASSDLILIPHRTEKSVHGTTIVYVPQIEVYNDLPIFFLYANHLDSLLAALKALKKSYASQHVSSEEDDLKEIGVYPIF